VHLAGKTNGSDGFAGEARNLKRFANCEGGRAPPIARVLLRPAGLGAAEVGVFFHARGEDGAVLVEDDGAGSASSDVDAESWDTASFLRRTYAKFLVRMPFGERKRTRESRQRRCAIRFRERSRCHLRLGALPCQRGAEEGSSPA
jgi:hypothetical protein